MRRGVWLLVLSFATAACSGPAPVDPARSANGTTTVDAPIPSPSATPGTSSGRPCDRYTLIGQIRGGRVTALRHADDPKSDIESFSALNAQGARQVFPLVDRREVGGATWYLAMLPIRPNGSTGWIAARDLRLQRSDYRLSIDISRLRLSVLRLCSTVATYPIGVGTVDTPTPHGTFFLNSLLRPPTGSIYGAFAFGLSAFSDVIRDWVGGGIVGIHGTNDPSSIGRRVSHGCIRMRNEDIRALARRLPLGTLVTIR